MHESEGGRSRRRDSWTHTPHPLSFTVPSNLFTLTIPQVDICYSVVSLLLLQKLRKVHKVMHRQQLHANTLTLPLRPLLSP